MYIYKITNLINNKIYVGQTIRTIEARFKRHCYSQSSNSIRTAMNLAIRKYGKDNFKIELLDTATTRDELNIKENYWILKLNSLSPNGYNLNTGGDSKIMSEETKKKISIANKGRTLTEEHKEKIRIANTGYKVSDTTKKKLSDINKKLKIPKHVRKMASLKNSKLYILQNNDNIYVIVNMKNFCDIKCLHRSDLSTLCTGKRKEFKNYTLIKNCGKMGKLDLTVDDIKNYIKYNFDFNNFNVEYFL